MSRTIRLGVAVAGMAACLAIGLALGAQTPGGKDDAAFDRQVRAYLLRHPDVVVEAVDRLRIEPYRRAVETPFAGAWAGDPQGDVTLVVFTDYDCPYCRATAPVLNRLLTGDPKLKIVWREMPVLGPESEAAAAAALAAAQSGKYPSFHRLLFAENRPDRRGIAAAARAAGLDPGQLATEARGRAVKAEIAANLRLAQQLQIGATPFFVIGNRTYEGAIGYEALAAAVAQARKDRS